jgi:hypothetical protein
MAHGQKATSLVIQLIKKIVPKLIHIVYPSGQIFIKYRLSLSKLNSVFRSFFIKSIDSKMKLKLATTPTLAPTPN